MTISITIDGNTAEDIHREMAVLLGGTNASTTSPGIAFGGPGTTEQIIEKIAQETTKRASGRTRAAAADKAATQAISTGEERVDPEADKQDAKDEAAETAKEKAVDPVKLTHDDVKKMLGVYVQLYGMEAAQADGEGFIGCKKISEIPDTQAALAAAVLGIANGIEKNPKSRDVAGELDPEKLAALKPVVAAAKAVK